MLAIAPLNSPEGNMTRANIWQKMRFYVTCPVRIAAAKTGSATPELPSLLATAPVAIVYFVLIGKVALDNLPLASVPNLIWANTHICNSHLGCSQCSEFILVWILAIRTNVERMIQMLRASSEFELRTNEFLLPPHVRANPKSTRGIT
jgi:hypothetical protein